MPINPALITNIFQKESRLLNNVLFIKDFERVFSVISFLFSSELSSIVSSPSFSSAPFSLVSSELSFRVTSSSSSRIISSSSLSIFSSGILNYKMFYTKKINK
eukprot:TRINITY_DN407_c0_g1_i2.p1 TRINITY_DN407_c0_g1~~TRINITY_DN407_c0_g1_i2.p1  ORF type:complete len:103 (-),score=12.44 TRINITY_DN407_c0_g1_i2:96-404(-)